MVGQKPSIGYIGDRLPLLPGAREMEWPARLAADCCVDRERHAHVHRVTERPPDERVRTMDRPAEAVTLGGGEENVLLNVIEVLVRQALLLFGEGRVRLNLCVRLEGAEIVLQPGDECDMPNRPLERSRSEQVLQHAPIDVAVLSLG